VLRAACSTVPRSSEGLIALVTDVEGIYPHLPHFALDDVDGIAKFILAQVGR
jgi:molybdopterin-guanine dinucleotide biosynthesis protein B